LERDVTEASLQLDPGELGTPPLGLKRLTLAFTDSVIERSYQLVAGAANTRDLVVGFLLGTGLWVFGAWIVDVNTPIKREPLLVICGGMVLVNIIGLIAVRRARTLDQQQWLAGGINSLSGIALLLLAEQALYFGRLAVPAVMLAALFAFVALRLRFIAAAAAVIPYLALYVVLAIDTFAEFRGLDFFLVGAAVVASIVGAYTLEIAQRRVFAQQRTIAVQKAEIELERAKSDRLLLAVLPASIALRLRDDLGVIADQADEVTVIFADLVNFTPLAEQIPPEELVDLLDSVFSQFDDTTVELGLEKIKTMGDAYMAAGGLPEPLDDHAVRAIRLGFSMLEVVEKEAVKRSLPLALRVGIHTGPVVAGVIGKQRFSYDLWGDAVNIASRMESHGVPGAIQVSAATKELVEAQFPCLLHKELEVKGHGTMGVYLVQPPITFDQAGS
jgi:class 3 adenylate cyclase